MERNKKANLSFRKCNPYSVSSSFLDMLPFFFMFFSPSPSSLLPLSSPILPFPSHSLPQQLLSPSFLNILFYSSLFLCVISFFLRFRYTLFFCFWKYSRTVVNVTIASFLFFQHTYKYIFFCFYSLLLST